MKTNIYKTIFNKIDNLGNTYFYKEINSNKIFFKHISEKSNSFENYENLKKDIIRQNKFKKNIFSNLHLSDNSFIINNFYVKNKIENYYQKSLFKNSSVKKYSQTNFNEFYNLNEHLNTLKITDKSYTKEAVKTSYIRLAKLYHPDINKNDESSIKKFLEIQNSYDILLKYFDTIENKNNINRNIFNINNENIDNLISNIFSKVSKDENKKEFSREFLKNNSEKDLKTYQNLLYCIKQTFVKNNKSMDFYDVLKIKKIYKKILIKNEKREKAKLLLHESQNMIKNNNIDIKNFEYNFLNKNSNNDFLDKTKNNNFNLENFIENNALYLKFKFLLLKVYEKIIKFIIVYCVFYFIYYNISIKLAYAIAFYMSFMILTT